MSFQECFSISRMRKSFLDCCQLLFQLGVFILYFLNLGRVVFYETVIKILISTLILTFHLLFKSNICKFKLMSTVHCSFYFCFQSCNVIALIAHLLSYINFENKHCTTYFLSFFILGFK